MARSSAPPDSRPPPLRPLLRAGLVALALGLVGCDHATKFAAEASLAGGRKIPIVGELLELQFAPNPDVAFSLLHRLRSASGEGHATSPVLLAALAAVALVVLLGYWAARRRRASLVEHAGFALVVGGAIGNLADRLVRGYVVDFIHLKHWPTFNVADVAVVVGLALVALGSRRLRRARVGPG